MADLGLRYYLFAESWNSLQAAASAFIAYGSPMPSQGGNMNKKLIAFSCIAWALAAILNTRPAGAYAAIPGLQNVTEVRVTAKYKTGSFTVCGDRQYSYMQLIAIPGYGPVWVAVEFVYGTGPKTATVVEVCENGDVIYGLDSCSC